MLRFLTILLCLVFPFIARAQTGNARFLSQSAVDSVVLCIYHYSGKELSMVETGPGEAFAEGNDSTYLISACLIQPKDAQNLIHRLRNRHSFRSQRALLYHFNLRINYFLQGAILQDIEISTLTGNITIRRYGCKLERFVDKENSEPMEIDPCLFQDSVSNKFSRYLIRILRKYDQWEVVETTDKLRIGG